MPLNNTATHYGRVTKTLHWLTVLLIVTVIPLGLIAHNIAYTIQSGTSTSPDADIARAALLFSLHKTLGLLIFLTALVRITWSLTQPRPGLLNADKPLEATLAHAVHWLLYGSLLLVPLTGWIHHAATTGFAPIWWPFGQSLPFVPKDPDVAARFAGLHMVLERVLVLSILLHVAGALKHHVIDKDATLRRMLPGKTDVPPLPTAHKSPWPIAIALGIWGAALGTGAAIGAYAPHDSQRDIATLAKVSSDWQVTSGTLGLEITQLGSGVQGEFADWTAAITFEPRDTNGPAGEVTVTVAIGSLTLGTVTDQAMGPDFFDAETFPTAVFTGQIARTDQGYVATGPLTLKGITATVELPFDLAIDADVATVSGTTNLERADFNIGQSVTDAATLGFTVSLAVALSATRATPET